MRVGFIGLGRMGKGMAHRLLSGGHDLAVYDVATQATIEFATAAGAFKHSVEGDVNVASVDEIEALVKGENVGKLLR